MRKKRKIVSKYTSSKTHGNERFKADYGRLDWEGKTIFCFRDFIGNEHWALQIYHDQLSKPSDPPLPRAHLIPLGHVGIPLPQSKSHHCESQGWTGPISPGYPQKLGPATAKRGSSASKGASSTPCLTLRAYGSHISGQGTLGWGRLTRHELLWTR